MCKKIAVMLVSLLISLVMFGCATGGQNTGNNSVANGGEVKSNFNFGCVKIGNVSLGCEGQASQQQSQNSTNQGTAQMQSGTVCGEAAMRMTCPSIAIPGTNCRRCQ